MGIGSERILRLSKLCSHAEIVGLLDLALFVDHAVGAAEGAEEKSSHQKELQWIHSDQVG